MKTLLIPIDFTQTNYNTIAFATEWCKKYEYKRVILLKSFYDLFDQIVMSAEYVNHEYQQAHRNDVAEKVNELIQQLENNTGCTVKIIFSEEPLLRSVLETIEAIHPDMIMLGTDNHDHSSDSFIAGSVISIAKISPVRVLIVPAGYAYQPVITALLPANFNVLDTLDKINNLQASPLWDDTKLLVLYVDPKERRFNPDKNFEDAEQSLHEYLKNFDHEVQYSSDKDIISGILKFTQNNNVQLIIAMPGKHSFLYSLTHISISEAIYRNAKEPVLILK